MAKRYKKTQRSASSVSRHQGAFGSGSSGRRFSINKKIYLLIPVLVVGIGVYIGATNHYFGLFGKSEDVEKGLIYATETKESPALPQPVQVQDGQSSDQPVSTPAANAETGIEGEDTTPAVETNQLSDGEERATDKAAAVNTEVDTHEVEVLGGEN